MAYRLQLPSSSSSSSLTLPHKNPLPFFTNPIRASSLPQNTPQFRKILKLPQWVSSFQPKSLNFLLSGTLALALSLTGVEFAEGKTGVNKPELLPKEFTTVIDVAGFLSDGQHGIGHALESYRPIKRAGWKCVFYFLHTDSKWLVSTRISWEQYNNVSSKRLKLDMQEKRIVQEIAALEKDTGYKLRVLAQNYPDTPGNILNFNVGATVDLDIPRSFWSRLAGKYGNIFYWKEKVRLLGPFSTGEDASIEAAVMAISTCLREPVGANNCSEIN
ncbi:hypothetical protein DH2020_040021 [Rehmannia glutinosa]|uniref:Uncharacterized protein n=1 Tax=Rehmannia glutinosa TaxID=99300 RepID=A0ABR0UUV4_REHGL